MASTFLSGKRRRLRAIGRSAVEGAAISASAALVWRALGRESAAPAALGLFWAWIASSLSVALLVLRRGSPFKSFLRAYAGGLALRAGILAGLMVWVSGRPWGAQASALGSYALGILFLLLLEYRQLIREKQ